MKVLFVCVFFLTLHFVYATSYLIPDMSGGYLCFVVSIFCIGVVTAIIGDVASHFGCTLGIKDSVTAIIFVALGTSIPGKEGPKHFVQHKKPGTNIGGGPFTIFCLSPQIRSPVRSLPYRTSTPMPASATWREVMRSTCFWVSVSPGRLPPAITASTDGRSTSSRARKCGFQLPDGRVCLFVLQST